MTRLGNIQSMRASRASLSAAAMSTAAFAAISTLAAAAATLLSLPGTASGAVVHEVSRGESLTSVAAADGLTVEQLAAANGLSPTSYLIAGSQIVIPPQGVSPSEATASAGYGEGEVAAPGATGDGDNDSDDGEAAPTVSASTAQLYEVLPGDTLTSIAERFGTTVQQLAAANGLNPGGLLLAGSTLAVASGGAERSNASFTESSVESPEASSSAATSQPVGEAAAGSPASPPYPTSEALSPEQVAAIAEENGVPGSLAAAVADQESGFNNALTSGSDARGEMQITPGTWDWINEALAGETLQPASASDNVRGGVLLLHSLLDATGGDESLAIAGYYQGLPSVRQHGVFPETQHYVENVQALQGQFGG